MNDSSDHRLNKMLIEIFNFVLAHDSWKCINKYYVDCRCLYLDELRQNTAKSMVFPGHSNISFWISLPLSDEADAKYRYLSNDLSWESSYDHWFIMIMIVK